MPALPRCPSSLGSPIITDDMKGGGGKHLTGAPHASPQTRKLIWVANLAALL